jgi:hypothetical protein
MVALSVWCAALVAVGSAGGTLRVTVTDASNGLPLAGAVVVLADVSRTAISDAGGRAVFTNVAPGPQHLAVRRLGYQPRVLHAFVGESRTLDLTVALTPLPTRLAAVRVESAPLVALRDQETDARRLGDRVVSLAAMRNHPLLAEPDAMLAIVGGHAAARPESPTGLNVFGGATDHLAVLVDEIPVLSPSHPGGTFGALNPDALERVELRVSPGTSALADGLSGVFAATTRAVPDRGRWTGGTSVTQSRLTLEQPFAGAGAGLLMSGRLLFPGLLGQKREPAHVDGDGRDALVRLAVPWLGGRLKLLAFGTRSDISLATRVPDAAPTLAPPRDDLSWTSSSLGAHWERDGARGNGSFAIWRAAARAAAGWPTESARSTLTTSRADVGGRGVVRWLAPRDTVRIMVRANYVSGRYRAWDGRPSPALALRGGRPSLTVQPDWTHAVTAAHHVTLGLTGSAYGGRAFAAPFAVWGWRPDPTIALSTSIERRYQFTQSARNPESLLSQLFATDLTVAAAGPIPVARADQAAVVAEWRPTRSNSVGGRVWSRRLHGLALPAVSAGGPFAVGDIATGRGTARGAALEASLAQARWGVVANYAVQHVRLTAGDTTWHPEYSTTHAADVGVVLFPNPATSLRFGLVTGVGRRASAFAGAFEWEACNLRDRGCEFAGGPLDRQGPLGGLALPRYARLDLGARKHWHRRLLGQDVLVAAYGTWSNLLDAKNVLTYLRDPTTGRPLPVSMRPSAPLVVGLDWSF